MLPCHYNLLFTGCFLNIVPGIKMLPAWTLSLVYCGQAVVHMYNRTVSAQMVMHKETHRDKNQNTR